VLSQNSNIQYLPYINGNIKYRII